MTHVARLVLPGALLAALVLGAPGLTGCRTLMEPEPTPGSGTGSRPAPVRHGPVQCPVCHQEQDADNCFTYVHRGLVYHFSTQECLAKFKKNPDFYIEKLETARNE